MRDPQLDHLAQYGQRLVGVSRVDRIARTAGCNKNLIYVYFENKETLFTTVLERHLLRVYEDLALTPDDLPGYAGRVFDFAMANPDLMRLMAWSNLEHQATDPASRAEVHEVKVANLAEAQANGKLIATFPPSFLLTFVMTLATAWSAANPFGSSLDPEAAKELDALRNNIVEAAKLITRAD